MTFRGQGPASWKPRKRFGPVVFLYLKTEMWIRLKLPVRRELLFKLRYMKKNSSVIGRFQILLWLYGPEKFSSANCCFEKKNVQKLNKSDIAVTILMSIVKIRLYKYIHTQIALLWAVARLVSLSSLVFTKVKNLATHGYFRFWNESSSQLTMEPNPTDQWSSWDIPVNRCI